MHFGRRFLLDEEKESHVEPIKHSSTPHRALVSSESRQPLRAFIGYEPENLASAFAMSANSVPPSMLKDVFSTSLTLSDNVVVVKAGAKTKHASRGGCILES